ncbi:ATP-dependent zinc metalloprotease FTSH 10, mitochondrial-like [Senna tora]|uniref:ATP-dependent zinc metalloprotease FTSH 10, mitochondrial-like n=1 Tax=Senna tora TaxID=362788 RepID=A0A835CNF1_9FABA|nr:ATP-dependent zinc metalloprotease FTSH 10, mitochondrial-like [Senna tora]
MQPLTLQAERLFPGIAGKPVWKHVTRVISKLEWCSIAYHEAAHAVAGWTKEQLFYMTFMTLGFNAAKQVLLGKISTGA